MTEEEYDKLDTSNRPYDKLTDSSGNKIYFEYQTIFNNFYTTKKHRPRGNHVVRKNSALSASSGVRTLDTLIKSQVLYQLS